MKECTTPFVEMLSLSSSNLLSVDLSSCNIGNFPVDNILSRLLHLDRLTTLKLSGNILGPKSGEALGDVLRGNKCLLQNLSLAGCSLGKSGVFNILRALSENRTLEILNLAANVSVPLKESGIPANTGSAQQPEKHSPQNPFFTDGLGGKNTPQKSLFKEGLGNTCISQKPRFEEASGEKHIAQKSLFHEGWGPLSSDKTKGTSNQSSRNEYDLDKFRDGENSANPIVADYPETEIAKDSDEEDATTVEEGKVGEKSKKPLFSSVSRHGCGLYGGKVSILESLGLSRPAGVLVSDKIVSTRQQIPLQGKSSSVIGKLAVETEDIEMATEHDSNWRAQEGGSNIETRSFKENIQSDETWGSHGRQPETGTEFSHGVRCVLQRSTEQIVDKEMACGEECLLGESCSLTSAKRRHSVESGRHSKLFSGSPGPFNEGSKLGYNQVENDEEIGVEFTTSLLSLVREVKGLLILDLSWNGLREEDVRKLQDSFDVRFDN